MSSANDRVDLDPFLFGLAQHGRTDAYSAYVKEKESYRLVNQPISELIIRRHRQGTQPIAIYLMKGDTARIAALDIDNHDGVLSWTDIIERVLPLYANLIAEGYKPLVFRSGGGAGIHIWLLWEGQQPARNIRRFLIQILEQHGLVAGAAGIRLGTVEIYPKQDCVDEGRFGNPIALPLARASVPLDEHLAPMALDDYWPPRIEDCYSPALAAELDDRASAPAEVGEVDNTPNVVLDGDIDEARAALKYIPSESYDTWIRMGLILKSAFRNDGFEVWRGWSESSPGKYPGEPECRRVWEGLKPRGLVGLGSLFRAAQDKGWNGPSDPVIREMNARFGILTHANKTMIIVKDSARREEESLVWLSKPTFLDRLASEKAFIGTDVNGKPVRLSKAHYWLAHQRACHYHRVIFDPDKPPGHNGRDWNLWTGFVVDPVPGSWDRLKGHIFNNICRGDQALFDWLLNWMALGVQHPAAVIGTAPVFRGYPGTGKGFLANAYGQLWGAHYTTITHHEHVMGRFNVHLVGKRFVYIDEGIFGGNRRDAGVIKTRVTEDWVMLEPKGVDAIKMRNRMIFMIASNEDSIVPADKSDRRWQVLDVGDRNREDREYFAAIKAELESGGYAAMLHELLHRDIKIGPDPRRIIKTEALFDQMIRAQSPEVRYVYQILDDGLLPQQSVHGNGPGATTIAALWGDMQKTQANARYVQRNALGRFLRNTIPGIVTAQNGIFVVRQDPRGERDEVERSTRYVFPALADCRRAFEACVGQPVPWSNELADWQKVNAADREKDLPF